MENKLFKEKLENQTFTKGELYVQFEFKNERFNIDITEIETDMIKYNFISVDRAIYRYLIPIWNLEKIKVKEMKNMSATILKPIPQYENSNILKETLFIENIQNGEVNKEVIKTYLLTFTNGIKVIFKLEYIVIDKEKIMVNHVITQSYTYFNKFSKIIKTAIIKEICENKYFRYQIMCLEIGDKLKSENFIVRCV